MDFEEGQEGGGAHTGYIVYELQRTMNWLTTAGRLAHVQFGKMGRMDSSFGVLPLIFYCTEVVVPDFCLNFLDLLPSSDKI